MHETVVWDNSCTRLSGPRRGREWHPTLCNGAADALISTVPLSSLTGAVGRPTSYSVTVYQLEVCSPTVLDPHMRTGERTRTDVARWRRAGGRREMWSDL